MADQAPVVVPLDGSKNAENALPMAAAMARAYGAPIRLVHVLDDDLARNQADIDRAQEQFAAYGARLAEREGLPEARATVLTGSAARAVIDFAEGAQMVVLATHGRSGLKATLIGSVADKIVRGANVPTLVVPGLGEPWAPRPGPIVVGVDGSEAAEIGLAAARDLALRIGGSIVIVRAYSVPVAVGAEFAYYPADLMTTYEQAAKEYLLNVAQAGEKTLLVNGNAADSIARVADDENAAMIVVASSGKGLAARIALGSTTDRLMHNVNRPLLVIPAKG